MGGLICEHLRNYMSAWLQKWQPWNSRVSSRPMPLDLKYRPLCVTSAASLSWKFTRVVIKVLNRNTFSWMTNHPVRHCWLIKTESTVFPFWTRNPNKNYRVDERNIYVSNRTNVDLLSSGFPTRAYTLSSMVDQLKELIEYLSNFLSSYYLLNY